MSIEIRDFITAAEHCKAMDNELGYRTCVSRVYYAMYHEALSFVGKDLPSFEGVGVHKKLVEYLLNPPPEMKNKQLRSKHKRAARILGMWKNKRVCADYELDSAVQPGDADDSLEAYKQLLNILES
ncbi:hypothetical protein VB891_002286 [Vibrio cholerae]|nr:hypothetical protein [Vibrio cholerae]